MSRAINNAGLDLIKQFEGLRLTVYQDVAGIWTIGYGHTHDVTEHTADITQVVADLLLRTDLKTTESEVNAAIADAATTDNQFAAMVSLCFNIGSGNFRLSSVLRYHLLGRSVAAAGAFLQWNKAHIDGVLTTVPGLTRRRAAERSLYLRADAA